MERDWSNEEVDEITIGIWSHHVGGGEADNLSKKYSGNFDKARELVQQAIVQIR